MPLSRPEGRLVARQNLFSEYRDDAGKLAFAEQCPELTLGHMVQQRQRYMDRRIRVRDDRFSYRGPVNPALAQRYDTQHWS